MTIRLARPFISAPSPLPRAIRMRAFCAMMLALALSACSKEHDEKLEARLAALEAKADAAEQRSRQALSMAAQSNPAPVADVGTDPGYGEGQDPGVTDDSPDSAVFDNTIEAPIGPAIAPGN